MSGAITSESSSPTLAITPPHAVLTEFLREVSEPSYASRTIGSAPKPDHLAKGLSLWLNARELT